MFKKIRSTVGKLFTVPTQQRITLFLSATFWKVRKYFLGVEIIYNEDFTNNWQTIKKISAQDKERNFTLYQVLKLHNSIFTKNHKNIIEFGVFRGSSLMTITKFVNDQTDIYGIDQFGEYADQLEFNNKYDDHYINYNPFNKTDCFKYFDYKKLEEKLNDPTKKKRVKILPWCFPKNVNQKDYDLLKNLKFSFVNLDLDLYEATLAAINFVLPRLEQNAIILMDDFNFINQTGVSKAVKDSNLSLDKTIQTSSGQLIYFNTN